MTEPSKEARLEVTPEMKAAWTSYDPPPVWVTLPSGTAGLLRHAFYSGWLAALSLPAPDGDEVEVVEPCEGSVMHSDHAIHGQRWCLRAGRWCEKATGQACVKRNAIAAMPLDRAGVLEECARVAMEQRCERGTDWNRACVAISAAIRALGEKVGG